MGANELNYHPTNGGDSLLVPAEGLEPPTFGLQNHCSTN